MPLNLHLLSEKSIYFTLRNKKLSKKLALNQCWLSISCIFRTVFYKKNYGNFFLILTKKAILVPILRMSVSKLLFRCVTIIIDLQREDRRLEGKCKSSHRGEGCVAIRYHGERWRAEGRGSSGFAPADGRKANHNAAWSNGGEIGYKVQCDVLRDVWRRQRRWLTDRLCRQKLVTHRCYYITNK